MWQRETLEKLSEWMTSVFRLIPAQFVQSVRLCDGCDNSDMGNSGTGIAEKSEIF